MRIIWLAATSILLLNGSFPRCSASVHGKWWLRIMLAASMGTFSTRLCIELWFGWLLATGYLCSGLDGGDAVGSVRRSSGCWIVIKVRSRFDGSVIWRDVNVSDPSAILPFETHEAIGCFPSTGLCGRCG